jgi:outer membrane protein assembly factor BamB
MCRKVCELMVATRKNKPLRRRARKRPGHLVTALVVFIVALASWASAAPTGWRHDGSGRYPSSDAPATWSLDNGHHVVWRTKLPAWANSSPVVVGDKVFVTTEPSTLVALATRDGRILWRDSLTVLDALSPSRATHARAIIAKAKGAETKLLEVQKAQRTLSRRVRKPGPNNEMAGLRTRLTSLEEEQSALRQAIDQAARFWVRPRGDTIGYASATPLSDGKNVYVVYGSGVVASYTHSGRRRWIRWLGEPHRPMRGNTHGHAASPILVGGRLIVGLGTLQALDPTTGDLQWRAGTYDDFGTPVGIEVQGVPAVATPRGHVHRASDGLLMATIGADTVYVGPVADTKRIYWIGSTIVADATASQDYATWAMAISLDALDAYGGSAAPIWRITLGREAVYATPATDKGLLYVVNWAGQLTIIDSRTGERTDQHDLTTGMVSASPVITDGYLYIFGEDGRTIIGHTGRKFTFHANARTEGGRATPYASGGHLYVRSDRSVMNLGGP